MEEAVLAARLRARRGAWPERGPRRDVGLRAVGSIAAAACRGIGGRRLSRPEREFASRKSPEICQPFGEPPGACGNRALAARPGSAAVVPPAPRSRSRPRAAPSRRGRWRWPSRRAGAARRSRARPAPAGPRARARRRRARPRPAGPSRSASRQRRAVDQPAPGGVDEDRPRLEALQRRRVDQVPRLAREGDVQRDEVGAASQGSSRRTCSRPSRRSASGARRGRVVQQLGARSPAAARRPACRSGRGRRSRRSRRVSSRPSSWLRLPARPPPGPHDPLGLPQPPGGRRASGRRPARRSRSVSTSGVLVTTTPRSRQAARSTLS